MWRTGLHGYKFWDEAKMMSLTGLGLFILHDT